jgi:hypothetical protein
MVHILHVILDVSCYGSKLKRPPNFVSCARNLQLFVLRVCVSYLVSSCAAFHTYTLLTDVDMERSIITKQTSVCVCVCVRARVCLYGKCLEWVGIPQHTCWNDFTWGQDLLLKKGNARSGNSVYVKLTTPFCKTFIVLQQTERRPPPNIIFFFWHFEETTIESLGRSIFRHSVTANL